LTLERARLGLLAALAATIPVSIFASQMLLALSLVVLLARLLRRKATLPRTPLDGPLLALVVWTLLAASFAAEPAVAHEEFRRIERHLRRSGLIGTFEDDAEPDGEGDPEGNLAASAVWGQTPPAWPQRVSRLAPLEPHALAYDKPLCARAGEPVQGPPGLVSPREGRPEDACCRGVRP